MFKSDWLVFVQACKDIEHKHTRRKLPDQTRSHSSRLSVESTAAAAQGDLRQRTDGLSRERSEERSVCVHAADRQRKKESFKQPMKGLLDICLGSVFLPSHCESCRNLCDES